MAKVSEKVAISLDRELLGRAERLRATTGETRSALVARALLQLVQQESSARRIEEYVDAYKRIPETPADVRAARALARRSISKLAWDEE